MSAKGKKSSAKSRASKRGPKKSKDETPDPLRLAAPQFHGRLDGLRELQEIISPHAAALDITGDGGVSRLIEKGGFSESGTEVMRAVFESDDESGESADGDTSGAQGNGEKLSPEREQKALEFADVVTNELNAFQGFLRRFVRNAVAPREELLNSSLLTLAVAAFENLLALLVTEHLRRFPGTLESEEKAFSLADLQGVGSIDDARTVLIERRVDNFMRKGLDDWSAWAVKTLGASFDELCIDLDSVKEIFQRRHLVVHAGGIVNRMYLERAPRTEESRPELGTYLSTNGDYILGALDELEVLGDLLLFSAWNKWTQGKDRDAGREEFESRVLELMDGGRWAVVQRLCDQAAEFDVSTATHLVFQVNRWIAMKNLGRFDDQCRAEVEQWDTSALATVYVMARSVLLDEEKRALELLEIALASGEIERRAAETWPLLKDLREGRKFKKAVAKGLAQAQAAETVAENASKSKSKSRGRKSKAKSTSGKSATGGESRQRNKRQT